MEEYADEIILLAACTAVSLLFGNAALAIIGILLAVSLACVCEMTRPGYRLVAQVVFIACALFFAPVLFFLPVCAYAMLHERAWALRVLWLVPLVVAPLSGEVSGIACVAVACVCAAAVLMGIKDARMRAERLGMQFAFDDLRERNLGLLAEREALATTEAEGKPSAPSAGVLSQATGPFCSLTEREYAVAKLVAEGMDNRDIAASLFLSEGTVRNHISSILGKLELSNRTQIAIMYYKG